MRFKEKQYLKKALGECPEDIKAMFRDEVSFKCELLRRKCAIDKCAIGKCKVKKCTIGK